MTAFYTTTSDSIDLKDLVNINTLVINLGPEGYSDFVLGSRIRATAVGYNNPGSGQFGEYFEGFCYGSAATFEGHGGNTSEMIVGQLQSFGTGTYDNWVITLAGSEGEKGATGLRGLSSGIVGDQGATGPRGLPGATGIFGATGATGSMGATGSPGVGGGMGLQGPRGYVGASGPIGPTGPRGFLGQPGVRGATGSSGLQGIPGLFAGRGATGASGATGPQGEPGTYAGRGDTGPTGPRGPTGPTGATGAASTVAGPTGATGFWSYAEPLTGQDGLSGYVELDYMSGCTFYFTNINSDVLPNFINVPQVANTTIVMVMFIQQGSQPVAISSVQVNGTPQTILWLHNSIPVGTANKLDVFTVGLIQNATAGTFTVTAQAASYG